MEPPIVFRSRCLKVASLLFCLAVPAVLGAAAPAKPAAPRPGARKPAPGKKPVPPPVPAPVVLSLEALGIPGTAGAMAVSDDGHRVYLGRQHSYDRRRLNLIVVTPAPDGSVVGAARRYLDSPVPLPDQTHATVTSLLVDSHRRKLYLTGTLGAAKTPEIDQLLTVYDLDANGEPRGRPRSYACGNPHRSLLAMARHPRLDRLYMVGWGGNAVYSYELDSKGEPRGEPRAFPVGGHGKYTLAFSPGGERLYLGTYPDRLEILDLNKAGEPVGQPRVYAAGVEQSYLRFDYTPRALYLRRGEGEKAAMAEWPLGPDGNPAGAVHVRPEIGTAPYAVDPRGGRLWWGLPTTFRDALIGKTIPEGVGPAYVPLPLRPTGRDFPVVRPTGSRFRQAAVRITAGAGGRAVLLTQPLPGGPLGNRFSGSHLRVTVLEAEPAMGTLPPQLPVTIEAGDRRKKLAAQPLQQAGAWENLDGLLRDRLGAVFLRLHVEGAPLARLRVRLEVADGPGTKTLKALEEEVQGSAVGFFLPGYAFEPVAARVGAIELLSEHARKYLAAARAGGLKPEERPREFVIAAYHLMGGQGHLGQLKTQAEALSLLGINTVNAYNWGALPPEQVDGVLDSFGLSRRALAVYSPPSYFHFDSAKMSRETLDRWAKELVAGISHTNGGTPADVVDFKLADEPGWYYPTMLQEIRRNPVWLETFRAYLREQGLTPEELGRKGWSDVYPLGASVASDLPRRKLFYWTMRFFPDAAVRGHALAREALERAFGRPVNAAVNWNNWGSRWYVPSPNRKIANNPVVDPDSAYGSFHWFESGRANAHMLWSEDWFGDQDAQQWSAKADLLRSGAMQGRQSFGGYVIGRTLGAHPEGAKYKILSLIGHGAKTVDFFTWGPEFLFPGNCWSERLDVYRPLAEALRLVGRGERLLYPGRPERGKVAVHLPSASSLWDDDSRMPHYHQEVWSLHHALAHAGYTVDFVDDDDLAGDALATQNYSVLYLTGPNLARKAQEQVRGWVAGGGHLAVLPGAAVADEYNTPTDLLDPVVGMKERRAVRETAPQLSENLAPVDLLQVAAEAIPTGEAGTPRGQAPPMPIYGPVIPLDVEAGRPVARFRSGAAGVVARGYEKGSVLLYAFFPGWQYWVSPDRSDRSRLPRGWGEWQRHVAVAPARLARTSRPAWASVQGVEVCRLQSEKGVALVLLNWTDRPLDKVTITVPRVPGIRKVTSVERSPITGAAEGDTVKLTLPLKSVDVLLLE